MDDERFLTLIRAPCFPQAAEAGGTCMGQSCAGAPRMEAPHLHLAARRCCPPSSKHDQLISLVLIGLRLEQQFGYGMHSCRNLTPPGLSRTMSDLDLHSRFLTVRIGIIYLVSGVGGSVLSSLPSLSALLELCSDSLVPCCPSSSPTGPFTQTRCRSSLLALRCKSFGRKCGFRTKLH